MPRRVRLALTQRHGCFLTPLMQMVTHTSDVAFCEQVNMVFQRYHAFADVELQQRSIEYYSLAQLHGSTLKDVLVRLRCVAATRLATR
jgi:hypothetical protein